MSTLATDSFTGTGSLGANWTDIDAGWARVTDVASVTFGGGSSVFSARYTGVSFPNDQWAQIQVGTGAGTTDEGVGPIVRATSGGDVYLLQGNTTETRIYKRISGTFTQLGTDGPAVGTGDLLYLEIQGTNLVANKNGSNICGSPISDTDIAAGSAGIWGSATSGTITLDNFTAGDFVSTSIGAVVETNLKKRTWRPRPFGPGNVR